MQKCIKKKSQRSRSRGSEQLRGPRRGEQQDGPHLHYSLLFHGAVQGMGLPILAVENLYWHASTRPYNEYVGRLVGTWWSPGGRPRLVVVVHIFPILKSIFWI